MTAPLPFRWTGEAMEPMPGFAKRADAAFTVGEVYRLDAVEGRSAASHRQYFAAVGDIWQSLPDHLAERFPTSEHLRKYGLIRAGFADRREILAGSRAEALRLAAFIRPMDEFAIVEVKDAVVVHWTARSQSQRAMGKVEFQASKEAVLDVLAAMVGSTAEDVRRIAA